METSSYCWWWIYYNYWRYSRRREIKKIADELIEELTKPIKINNLSIKITFYIGIAVPTGNDENQLFNQASIALHEARKLETIAEGVETIEQLDLLTSYQCDCLQGYLFSKPLLPEEVRPLLTTTFERR